MPSLVNNIYHQDLLKIIKYMNIFPSEQEVESAVNLLVEKYKIPSSLLTKLFGRNEKKQSQAILKQLGKIKLDKYDIAELLVYRKGIQLFSGSTNEVKEFRLHLLKNLSDSTIKELWQIYKPNGCDKINSPSYMRRPLAEKKWYTGGRWAKDFVESCGFPPIFAGVRQSNSSPTLEDIQPRFHPPELEDFQRDLKEKMLEVLTKEGNKTRCVVTLPTGGGKTRVAVESFIEWMQPRFANGQYLIWIAQTEELCEQAIACISQMWSSKEFMESLRVYRFFGGRNIDPDDLQGGAVIASIHQLYNRVKDNDKVVDLILRDTGAMIIDEVHHSVTMMYNTLLDRAEAVCGKELFPICGLTATPGRSDLGEEDETSMLVDRFQSYLIKPNLGREYQKDPLQYFRDHQYLANAHHIVYRSGREYKLTEEEIQQIESDDNDSPTFLRRLSEDKERNKQIIKRLLAIPKDEPTLIYACTVAHAHVIAAILTYRGRRTGVIESDTPLTIRRGLIRDFRESKVNFLANYGVLTTGFDAPKVKNIVICRPTTSKILYEQIVGRGLRGSKFGGTNSCTVIDFADNISNLGQPLSYARFSQFWTDEKEECA